MLLELLRLALVLLLAVALPGLLLVNALFPTSRARLTATERGYLAVAAGILLAMLVGVTLGSIPHGDGRGYFQTMATGFPHVEIALLAVSALLFYVGLVRGAYPRVAARYPRLAQPDARPPRRMRMG